MNWRAETNYFIKFLIVGVFATIVDFAVLNFLAWFLLQLTEDNLARNVLINSSIAYIAGVTFSFAMNRFWIYPTTKRQVKIQVMQFFVVYGVALLVRLVIVLVSFSLFKDITTTINDTNANQVASNLSQALAIGVTLMWNFSINRLWTFGDVSSPQS